MTSLIQNIAFAFRLLRRHPVENALAIVALAIGVGLSTAMFSILWGTVLRGLPYKDADLLVRVETFTQGEKVTPTDADFLAWRRSQRSFQELSAFLGSSFNLSSTGEPAERCNGAFVAANLFRIVQVPPLLGRDFQAADEAPNAPLVAILSAGLWKRHFNRDPNVLGKLIKLNGQSAQVVGVMPGDFGFPLHQEIWVPLQLDPRPDRPVRIQVFGKLQKKMSLRQAEADLQVNAAPRPPQSPLFSVRLTPYVNAYTEDLQPALRLLFGASFGLLLVVCGNVSGLLTAQTIARLPELAVRSAIGATRFRLLGQLMTETAVLAVAGAVLSLPLAARAIEAYVTSQGGELRSFWMDTRLDAASIAYAMAITILVSFLSALAPFLHVTGRRLNEVLKRSAGKGASKPPGIGSGIRLVAQLALSFTLLAATALLIGSLGNKEQLNCGFAPDHILTARIDVPYGTYGTSEEKVQFFDALENRLDEDLGPHRAAFASMRPGSIAEEPELEIEGQPRNSGARQPTVPVLIASHEYFRVLRVEALQGRTFEPLDRLEGQPVAVVNRGFALRYFANRTPLGARLRLGGPSSRWRTIIGVVPDLVMGATTNHRHEGVYLPLKQAPVGWLAILLRTSGHPADLAKPLQRSVAAIDPEIPVFAVSTLQQDLADDLLSLKTMAQIFISFGASALFLSLLGVYGVTEQRVTSRSREMAIRLALGARKIDLVLLVQRTALLEVGAGIAAGALLSLGTSRLLASLLFEVDAWEPSVASLVTGLMILAGLLACLVPALKVLRAEPAEVLRGD